MGFPVRFRAVSALTTLRLSMDTIAPLVHVITFLYNHKPQPPGGATQMPDVVTLAILLNPSGDKR